MEPLVGVVKNYDWGSVDAIAGIRGVEPSGLPEAELWFGAHEQGSAVGGSGRSLRDRIAADPEAELGPAVVHRFGVRLPYLLKILAAAEPLSIQAHPTAAQARAGYAREDAAGFDVAAPDRSYRDRNHKPELIVALTPFEALMGFRPPGASARFLRRLDVDRLDPLIGLLDEDALDSALRWVLTEVGSSVVDEVVRAAPAVDEPHGELLARLGANHPGDPGVLTAALLNRVVLEPGEGLYLDAGTLHAYVGGVGVEVMANSDNVLRGGLTAKHVDVDELLAIVVAAPIEPDILAPTGATTSYPLDVPEFALTRLVAPEDHRRRPEGPEIVLVTSGEARIASGDGSEGFAVAPGQAAWVPASTAQYTITGTGLVFVVAAGALHSIEG